MVKVQTMPEDIPDPLVDRSWKDLEPLNLSPRDAFRVGAALAHTWYDKASRKDDLMMKLLLKRELGELADSVPSILEEARKKAAP